MTTLTAIVISLILGAQQTWVGPLDDNVRKMLIEQAEREARQIILEDLFAHYDIVTLEVLKIEGLNELRLASLTQDYALARATLQFSAKRNSSKHRSLDSWMFEPENCTSSKVPGWFYLHCGVPVGYVFKGKLEILMALTDGKDWRSVRPTWRTRRDSPLKGYLVEHEGAIVFPDPKGH